MVDGGLHIFRWWSKLWVRSSTSVSLTMIGGWFVNGQVSNEFKISFSIWSGLVWSVSWIILCCNMWQMTGCSVVPIAPSVHQNINDFSEYGVSRLRLGQMIQFSEVSEYFPSIQTLACLTGLVESKDFTHHGNVIQVDH
jgi:hypothetical protein